MHEIWKPVAGYEGKYEVSNKGNVKSLSRLKHLPGRCGFCMSKEIYLKPMNDKYGYLTVGLLDGKGKRKIVKIHRLVADAFLGHPDESKCEINHIDGNKTNNNVKNLEWCSHQENLAHAKRIGLNGLKVLITDTETGEVHNFEDCRTASLFLGHNKFYITQKRYSCGNEFQVGKYYVRF